MVGDFTPGCKNNYGRSKMSPISVCKRCFRDGLDTSGDGSGSVLAIFHILPTHLTLEQKVQKNREDLRGLCKDAVEIIKIIQDQISCYGSAAVVKFRLQCEEFAR
jgi:hypothetical protein